MRRTTHTLKSPVISSFSPDTNIIGDGVTNANHLKLGGTAVAFSVVDVYDGTTLLGATTADGNGAWSFTTGTLADGFQIFTATDILAGNTSAASSVVSILVDTHAPAAPVIVNASITATNHEILSGTAEANSNVAIYDGATQLGTVTANGSGAWSFTSGALAAGLQTFTATATDAAGNVSLASHAVTQNIATQVAVVPEPAIAAAQNYTHLTFDDEFNSSSTIDTSNSQAAGFNWYTQNWFSTSATNSNNIHVSNGVLELGGGTGGAAINSAFANSSGGVTGSTFGGGAYIEASIQYNPAGGAGATIWPAFWGEAIQHIVGDAQWAGQASGYDHFAEVDFMEYMNGLSSSQYLGTIHDWSGAYSSSTGYQYDVANYDSAFINIGAVDWSVYHTYGLSWVPQSGNTPGHVTWYFDGQAESTIYWLGPAASTSMPGTSGGSFTPSTSGQAASTYSILDGEQLALSLQTDSSWPMYVDWVRVWQPGPAPKVTESLATDTGSSLTDKITSNDMLTGSADPNAVIHFTVDGSPVAGTATANANGLWAFTPTGLADGTHTLGASETDAAGITSNASLTFTLDTTAPTAAFGAEVLSAGNTVTLTGTTAEANDSVSLYNGSTLLWTEATGSDGSWSFNGVNLPNAVYVYTVTATDVAGNTASSNAAILGSSNADTLVGTSGNDFIIGNGGNDKFTGGGGADTMTAGSGSDTFIFNAVADSTPASHDMIISFDHVRDIIQFTSIAGINAVNGVPTFQGQLTGSGNLTLNAHSVGYIEVGGNTEVLVNTSNTAETVTAADPHAANMEIILSGIHLGLTSSDFHLA